MISQLDIHYQGNQEAHGRTSKGRGAAISLIRPGISSAYSANQRCFCERLRWQDPDVTTIAGSRCARLPRRWVLAYSPRQRPSARLRVPRRGGDRGHSRDRILLRDRQLARVRHGQRPVHRSRSSAAATAATWAWRGTGPAGVAARPATSSPGRRQRQPGERELRQVPHRRRRRRLLVHGRPRRRPALERHRRRGYQLGRAPGGADAGGDQGQVHPVPGDLGRHRDAGDRPRAGQRLEQRLHLAVQRQVKQVGVPAAVDRAELNGFAAYITSHSKFKVGVYSPRRSGPSIFGTGTAASIPNTYEWTYWPETSNLAAAPTGWCLHGVDDVRAVLRRADLVEQVRPDVAVVGRRWHHQRPWRLRPDRRRADEVTQH